MTGLERGGMTLGIGAAILIICSIFLFMFSEEIGNNFAAITTTYFTIGLLTLFTTTFAVATLSIIGTIIGLISSIIITASLFGITVAVYRFAQYITNPNRKPIEVKKKKEIAPPPPDLLPNSLLSRAEAEKYLQDWEKRYEEATGQKVGR